MSDSILLKGKHNGSTYQHVLDNDLPYCEYLLTLKFVTKEFKPFIEWLNDNIQKALNAKRDIEIERLNKLLTKPN